MSVADLVIRGAHVLALDAADREWPRADVVIGGGSITAVGPGAGEGVVATRTIDGTGLLAMPGLVNAHFHSPGNLMKGMLPGLPLEVFMLYEVPPLASDGDAGELVRVRTQIGAVEMLKRGITAVHDDAYHVPAATAAGIDAMMQAYADVGIRATVAIDQPNVMELEKLPYLAEILPPAERDAFERAPRQSTGELLQLYAHLIERWHGAAGGRLSAAVSCSAPQRVTADYFAALAELSRRHDLPFDIHILETRLQRVLGAEKYGRSLVRYVHDLGLLDERMMVIHAIWVDDADIALLARAGCTVAHNPVCNLRLGSGVMPYLALREAGVPLCIGTDEMNTDDTANLWQAGKLAAMLATLDSPDYHRWPDAREILAALTSGGARALRQADRLGRLAPGCAADVILLDLDTHAFTPLNDLRRQLVFCEDGSSVRYTVVAGRVVVDDGRVTTLDERALRAAARTFSARSGEAQADARRLEPYYRRMIERSLARDVGMHRRLAR